MADVIHIGTDVLEDELLRLDPHLLDTLLTDHTTGRNIFWATDDYASLGAGYGFSDPIRPELITGEHSHVIMPRVLKSKAQQTARSKDKAEVFTPSWICNAQNNLVDDAWFGRQGTFNTEHDDHSWTPTSTPVVFPTGKTWRDYVRDTRLEITCGEAPYLVSRYDTTTGQPIPVSHRIGLLDRKLRVVSENTDTSGDWLHWAQEAYKSIFAYEWQGDNLLLARENLLATFVDYYTDKFGRGPVMKSMLFMAYIISWNVFQMDGLKYVVPCTCHDVHHKPRPRQMGLFDAPDTAAADEPTVTPCPGCRNNDPYRHNGTYCLIRDWSIHLRDKQKTRFVTLLKP